MPFKPTVSGGGMGGMIVQSLIQQKLQEQQDTKRLQELQKAYQGLLPSATEGEVSTLALATKNNVPITGNMLEEYLYKGQFDEYKSSLPADQQAIFDKLSPDMKRNQMTGKLNVTAEVGRINTAMGKVNEIVNGVIGGKAITPEVITEFGVQLGMMGISSDSNVGQSLFNMMLYGKANPSKKAAPGEIDEDDYQFMAKLSGVTRDEEIDPMTKLWMAKSVGAKTKQSREEFLGIANGLELQPKEVIKWAQDYMQSTLVSMAGTSIPGEKDFAGVYNRVMAKHPNGSWIHDEPADIKARDFILKNYNPDGSPKYSAILEYSMAYGQLQDRVKSLFADPSAMSFIVSAGQQMTAEGLKEFPQEWKDRLLKLGWSTTQISAIVDAATSMADGTFFEKGTSGVGFGGKK